MKYRPIISKNIRCRVPESFIVGEGSIVDDFCYFATQVTIGRFCHIANGVSVAGGRKQLFSLGDYSSISAGAKIWCSSDDFTCDMAALSPEGILIPKHTVIGDVVMEQLTIIGCNSVVMPGNLIPIGVAIGALSYVPPRFKFKEWHLYAGIPIRMIRKRNKTEILRQRDLLELKTRNNKT